MRNYQSQRSMYICILSCDREVAGWMADRMNLTLELAEVCGIWRFVGGRVHLAEIR